MFDFLFAQIPVWVGGVGVTIGAVCGFCVAAVLSMADDGEGKEYRDMGNGERGEWGKGKGNGGPGTGPSRGRRF